MTLLTKEWSLIQKLKFMTFAFLISNCSAFNRQYIHGSHRMLMGQDDFWSSEQVGNFTLNDI